MVLIAIALMVMLKNLRRSMLPLYSRCCWWICVYNLLASKLLRYILKGAPNPFHFSGSRDKIFGYHFWTKLKMREQRKSTMTTKHAVDILTPAKILTAVILHRVHMFERNVIISL
jgi:hypothetical protein